ncbi:MAG: CpXC domain-containing protein [Chloroflexota bacterium]
MQTQITCPNCGANYTADIYQIIDVGRNPELKEMLLSGQLNVAVCPQCGAGGRIATPLLYHDPDHDLFMVHVPQEVNMDQVRREEQIGRMVQQIVNQTPQEQRRGYMLQPQTMLTMQSFMEKVWETEGVTPEMLARQQKQVDLLRTLTTSSPDVQDYLIQERKNEIDESFFAILRAQIEAASQMDGNGTLISLLNLQAKLMTETEAGQQLEKRQMAIHALNRDVKQAGGLTPQLLLKYILANQEDEALAESIALSGQGALNYEFFSLLTAEIEKQEKVGNTSESKRLGRLRDHFLEMQKELQAASQQILQEAQTTLESILAAEDTESAIRANIRRIDDAFMHVLEARMIHAEQNGRKDQVDKLQQIQESIIRQIQGETPPEVRLLTELVSAETKEDREQMMGSQSDLLSPELLQVVEMLQDQARNGGQQDLAARLGEIRGELSARLLAA